MLAYSIGLFFFSFGTMAPMMRPSFPWPMMMALLLSTALVSCSTDLPRRDLVPLDVYKSRHFPLNPGFREQMQRGLPSINAEDIDNHSPHPNNHDQVEAAVIDALQLALVTLELIDNDNDVYPHYFARSDRAMAKEVFERVAGVCRTGNVMLSNIHIQTADINPPGCDEYTLAHTVGHETETPCIVLYPPHVWDKKAYTILPGTGPPEQNPTRYLTCHDVYGDDGRVSWRMET